MSPRTPNPPAAARIAALDEALRALAITDPMGADTETLASTLAHLNRAARWVAQEIEHRIDLETQQEATC